MKGQSGTPPAVIWASQGHKTNTIPFENGSKSTGKLKTKNFGLKEACNSVMYVRFVSKYCGLSR